MSGDERGAALHELSFWALYAGFCALLVPTLFVPGFFASVSGPELYKSLLILFGPWAIVSLLAVAERQLGGDR